MAVIRDFNILLLLWSRVGRRNNARLSRPPTADL